jgi:hypothetical protein
VASAPIILRLWPDPDRPRLRPGGSARHDDIDLLVSNAGETMCRPVLSTDGGDSFSVGL